MTIGQWIIAGSVGWIYVATLFYTAGYLWTRGQYEALNEAFEKRTNRRNDHGTTEPPQQSRG